MIRERPFVHFPSPPLLLARSLSMRPSRWSPSIAAFLLFAGLTLAADPVPPRGFTPLFNGKDLTGWHGWAIHARGAGPLDFAKLSPEDRQKRVAEWTEDAGKHWTVENGELVNDGKGAYLTTDKEFGDIELLVE